MEKVDKLRCCVNVSNPCLPRKHIVPKWYDTGSGQAKFHSTAKDLYRRVYFEVFDLAVITITSRFDQPGYKVYSHIKQLFVKACSDEPYEENPAFVAEFYGDYFDLQQLESQLITFRTLYSEKASEKPNITSMRNVLQSLSCAQKCMLDIVCRGFHILPVMPATNCTSERTFSALRRIKSYLRNSMIQARLNHLRYRFTFPRISTRVITRGTQ